MIGAQKIFGETILVPRWRKKIVNQFLIGWVVRRDPLRGDGDGNDRHKNDCAYNRYPPIEKNDQQVCPLTGKTTLDF